jgi:transcriptional regulator with XRE-family HTH domain
MFLLNYMFAELYTFVLGNVNFGMKENERSRLYRMIGDNIRQAREKIPLSQTKLAEKLGISRVSIVNIEKGRQHAPMHTLWDIAENLGVEVVELIPRQREFADSAADIHLDADTIAQIEEAANGDLVARRKLTEFIQMAKSKTQESI